MISVSPLLPAPSLSWGTQSAFKIGLNLAFRSSLHSELDQPFSYEASGSDCWETFLENIQNAFISHYFMSLICVFSLGV